MLEDTLTAFSLSYHVKLDGDDLGEFTSCEGLGCEVILESREEGGNNGLVWQLPTRIRYPTIKLSRPLGPDTARIAQWFSTMSAGYQSRTGVIQAMRLNGREPVARWGLLGVVPVRWSGPSFSPDSTKAVTETVEIAHHGFMS